MKSSPRIVSRRWSSFVRQLLLAGGCLAVLLGVALFNTRGQAVGQPPTVTINAPIDGSVAVNTNDLVVSVVADDPDGKVAKVALFRDGLFLAQALSSPYSFTLVNPAVGTNIFTAVATDDQGNTTTSQPVSVFVEEPLPPYFPPTVLLSAAGTNLVLTAPASLSLTAAATVYRDGLDRFDFQAIYAPLGQEPLIVGEGRLNPSTVTLSNLAVGQYQFAVVARDIYGGEATSSAIRVTVLPPAGLAVPLFRFTDLGVLGGEESSATGINQLGAVVGNSTVAAHSGEQRAFGWQAGVMRDIPHTDASTYGLAVNDLGQVTGILLQGGRETSGFVWSPKSGSIVLPTTGSTSAGLALNNHGQIVGSTNGPSNRRPVVWNLTGPIGQSPEMTILSEDRFEGEARAINDVGQIAGFVTDTRFSSPRAVLWANGVELDLGVTGALSGQRSEAHGINGSGQVVGQIALVPPVVQGFVWDKGSVRQLTPLVGSSGWPRAINDQGWSVGSSKPNYGFLVPEHALLWLGQIAFDLNTLVTNLNGAVLLRADAVNNQGQIVGTAFINGQRRAYLLTPTDFVETHVAPSVELANPVAGTKLRAGEPVVLLASVNAGAADVARVDFYAGHSVVATADTSPYAATWIPAIDGEVCLLAVAVDAAGYAARSATTCLRIQEASPRYQLANLGELGSKEARGNGINAAGDFVGKVRTEQGEVGFVFRGGIITYLQPPAAAAQEALDINAAGQVLVQQDQRAGILQGGAITWLTQFPAGSPESFGRAMNASGWVVGQSRTDTRETHAALFIGETVTDLGLTFGEYSQANAINDAGVVVGWSQSTPGQPVLSFIRQPDGSVQQFASTLGGSVAQATGINAAGVVIGNAATGQDRQRAFVYENGTMQSLGTLGGPQSFALDINGVGQIVGSSDNENFEARAFLFEHGTMTNLNRLLPKTNLAILRQAVAINARGQILANGYPSQGSTVSRVFLLNPISSGSGQSNEPPSVSVQLPAGETYDEGDGVPLLASATDQDGAVALVLFSSGTNQLGSISQPPYSLLWPHAPVGVHQVVATAFDNLGVASTSAPVTVTVRAFDPTAPAVGIVGEAPAALQNDIRQQLRRTELFSRVDILGALPSLELLKAYDSVLVHSQDATSTPPELGDRLADYIDAGHGVALALYASDTSRPVIQGRLASEGYLAWSNEQISSHGHVLMVKDRPDHPILAGVAGFDGGESAVYAHEMNLAPGSVQIASWATQHPLAAVRDVGAGRLVGLNFNPVSSAVSGLGWSTNSDGARLLGNALIWAASAPSNRFALATSSTNHNPYVPGEPVVLTASGTSLPMDGVVRFFNDGNLLGAVTNLPATLIWSNAPVGSHLLVATYTNAAGRLIASPGVPIRVDSRLSVQLVTPADGAVFYLPTNILMQVSVTNLDAPVVQVDYYIEHNQRVGSVNTPPFAFDFKLLPTGTFPVSAVAIDALGARRSSPVHMVTIVNTALPHSTVWKATEGDWSTAGNWTAGPPRAQDRGVVDQGTVRILAPGAVAESLVVGSQASAALVASGGSLEVGGQLLLGDTVGALGSLQLEAPSTVTADEIVLGLRGKGAAVHNSGKLTADQLILSGDIGGTGNYDLNDGELTVRNAVVGGNGVGRFIQRGGTHNVSVALQVGNRNGSWGTYQLSGGRLSVQFELIGANGSNPENLSALLQTGGTHQVLEELRVGESGDSGRLALSGGTLEVASLVLDTSWLDLVADPSTNRFRVTGAARLGGVLRVQLADGYVPLGGDSITLMTYGSREGTFAVTNLPPATNGVVWALEYQPKALVLRAQPPPETVIVSPITASPHEGLFQQRVTLSNNGAEPLHGSRIYFPGLPPSWQLYNAAGVEEGVPFIEVDTLIPPASSIQFVVQFLIPGETRPARQNYVVRLGNVARAGAEERPLGMEQIVRHPGDALQLQFTSGRNRAYRIEYSVDLADWRTVPQPVIATGGQTQWIDDGPPKTPSRPGLEGFRFYRVIALP